MDAEHAFDEAHIGETPLVELAVDVPATVYGKIEWFNLPGAHERTTAAEIRTQTDGEVTHFVAGAGTGGTVTGTGWGLHARGDVTVVGFEPARDEHELEGLKYLRSGEQYHPDTYDESVLDEKLYVDTEAGFERARELRELYHETRVPIADSGQYDRETVREHLRADGEFLVGPSSGGGVEAVHELHENAGVDADDVVVLMLCDRGDKYPEGELWGSRLR